jgi:hypothetical protein
MRWTLSNPVVVVALILPSLVAAQAPSYTPLFLGPFDPGRINEGGEVLGSITVGGAVRGLVVEAGEPYRLLPLPAGMVSSYAIDLNDSGVIVGAVSALSSPEFGGQAAAWDPDGGGGYTVRLLGRLPGHVTSRATAVNNLGDIVGYSSNSTFRYPVLFTSPGGVMDLSATGVFDPVDLNDQRVLVDHSFTAKRLDLDTMIAEDLGVPTPPGGPLYIATRAEVINETNQIAGAAILATSTDCDRQAARYTDGIGWQIFSSCGPSNGVYDMNDQGDVIMRLNLANYIRFEGEGTFLIEDLIVNGIGHWYLINSYRIAINNARQMVVWAHNPTTGEDGTLLLMPRATAVPENGGGSPASPARVSAAPNPMRWTTTIRYELPDANRVHLTIYDATGRLVRRLRDGTPEEAAFHAVTWDGRDERGRSVGSGVYSVRMVVGGEVRSIRLVLVR